MASQISIPGAVLGLQGAINSIFGLYGIFRATDLTSQLAAQFGGDIPIAMAYTLSLQLLNMGIFTIFAASRPSLHRRALIARACLHMLAAYLFWRQGPKLQTPAQLDAGFAVANAFAVLLASGNTH